MSFSASLSLTFGLSTVGGILFDDESHGSHGTPGRVTPWVPVQPSLTHDYIISSLLVILVFTHYNRRQIRKIKRVDYESDEFKWDDGEGETYKGKNS